MAPADQHFAFELTDALEQFEIVHQVLAVTITRLIALTLVRHLVPITPTTAPVDVHQSVVLLGPLDKPVINSRATVFALVGHHRVLSTHHRSLAVTF
jgi:hypothetical protein